MSPCSVLMESEVEHLSQTTNAAGIDNDIGRLGCCRFR